VAFFDDDELHCVWTVTVTEVLRVKMMMMWHSEIFGEC